jgi:hypothetical protein
LPPAPEKDHRMLAQQIALKDLAGVAIELEHAGIERQHVLGRDFGGRRGGLAGNRRHIGRKGLGVCVSSAAGQQYCCREVTIALHVHTPRQNMTHDSHGFVLERSIPSLARRASDICDNISRWLRDR